MTPRVERAVWVATVAVALAGIAAELARFRLGVTSTLLDKLSLSYEQNLPTWFASSLLLACAGALAVIGTREPAGAPFRRHWLVLAGAFTYLSLDETAGLHEQLNRFGPLPGIFHYAWVIPAAMVVAVFAAAYLGFLLHLEPRTRLRVAAAGCLYVGGALGVELWLGVWTAAHGVMNLGYRMIDALEESMELAGAALFLTTLVRILRARA